MRAWSSNAAARSRSKTSLPRPDSLDRRLHRREDLDRPRLVRVELRPAEEGQDLARGAQVEGTVIGPGLTGAASYGARDAPVAMRASAAARSRRTLTVRSTRPDDTCAAARDHPRIAASARSVSAKLSSTASAFSAARRSVDVMPVATPTDAHADAAAARDVVHGVADDDDRLALEAPARVRESALDGDRRQRVPVRGVAAERSERESSG
jgi:hypothetical protein